jgi:hypothetical protein
MHYSSNIQWESAVASIAYYEHFFMHCQFNYVKYSNIIGLNENTFSGSSTVMNVFLSFLDSCKNIFCKMVYVIILNLDNLTVSENTALSSFDPSGFQFSRRCRDKLHI